MTAMPQLVAAFNGFGGGSSALVALAVVPLFELDRAWREGGGRFFPGLSHWLLTLLLAAIAAYGVAGTKVLALAPGEALADEKRLRVLELLGSGELCVCDLAALAELSVSAVSH